MPEETSQPTVVASCNNCGDTHPLPDRVSTGTTTACPRCGSKSYTSESEINEVPKTHDERIRDLITSLDGVGSQTVESVTERFDTYYEFQAASEEELASIDGVGNTIASRIANSLS